MRKNLLVAALVGLCIVGMTACSRGEDNQQPADNMTQADATTATTSPAVTNGSGQNAAAQPATPAAPVPPSNAAPANTDTQPQNNTMDNMAPPAAKMAPSANDDTTSAQ